MMKKFYVSSFLVALVLLCGASFAFAEGDGPSGGDSTPPADAASAPSDTSASTDTAATPATDSSSGSATLPSVGTVKNILNAASDAASGGSAGPSASAPASAGGQSGFTALAPIPGLTDNVTTSAVNSGNLAAFFNNLYKYLIGIAAVLAVIMIIWGGLEISTQDSVSKHSDGKQKIYDALFGLVLVLAPVLVFSIINPSILNLSVNLPALDTKSGPVETVAPKALPICDNVIRQNCIPRAQAIKAAAQGLYTDPQSGGWCYQIKQCTTSGCQAQCAGSCNYSCGSKDDCTKAFAEEQKAGTVVAGASCTLYAK